MVHYKNAMGSGNFTALDRREFTGTFRSSIRPPSNTVVKKWCEVQALALPIIANANTEYGLALANHASG